MPCQTEPQVKQSDFSYDFSARMKHMQQCDGSLYLNGIIAKARTGEISGSNPTFITPLISIKTERKRMKHMPKT